MCYKQMHLARSCTGPDAMLDGTYISLEVLLKESRGQQITNAIVLIRKTGRDATVRSLEPVLRPTLRPKPCQAWRVRTAKRSGFGVLLAPPALTGQSPHGPCHDKDADGTAVYFSLSCCLHPPAHPGTLLLCTLVTVRSTLLPTSISAR